MAIYHHTTRMIGRSRGGSPVKALSYISGTELKDHRTGEIWNFKNKPVQDVQILLPDNAPLWAKDIQNLVLKDREKGLQLLSHLTNAAEKRMDAQVYREVEFSLPRELTYEQHKKLASEYIQDQFCSLGMLAIQSFHVDICEESGELNPHCHTYLLTRELAEDGLSIIKNREWNKKEIHEIWREQWAQYASFHLKMHGHDITLDHRSYQEQGIDIEPQVKLRKGVKEQEKRSQDKSTETLFISEGKGKPSTPKGTSFRDVQLRNLYRITRRPELVFEIITRHHSTFMWGDVQKKLHHYVDDPTTFQQLDARLKASKELFLLKPESRKDGVLEHAIYTTHSLLQSEKSLIKTAETLSFSQSHGISEELLQKSLNHAQDKLNSKGYAFSKDQEKAINHLVSPGQLKCIVGYAGAGKTTALEVCREVWETSGYRVYGLAPTGRAAMNLEESGIKSQTLHKFLKFFDEGRCQYNPRSILVLDEGGMVDMERFQKFLKAIETLDVKAVIIGDGAQLQPVEAGPAFRLVTKKIEASHLETIIRQKEPWQKHATTLFGQQHTKEALHHYQERGFLHIVEEKLPKGKTPDTLIKRYEIATRTAGLIYREMLRDCQKDSSHVREHFTPITFHQDYEQFLSFKAIQRKAAIDILKNPEVFRPHLEKRSIDSFEITKCLIAKDKTKKEQIIQAQSLLKDKKLDHLIGVKKLKDHTRVDVRDEAKKALIEHWKDVYKKNPSKSISLMAYSNRDVRDLNEKARSHLKTEGRISSQEFTYTIIREEENDFGKKVKIKEERSFSKGDRIVFTRNKKDLGCSNGSIGTILSLSHHKITVELDGGKTLTFSPHLFPYFDQGWAITIHKSQGTTVDISFVLASHEMNQNLTYVALSRHRENTHVYMSYLDFWRQEKVGDVLSKSGDKLGTSDYLDVEKLEALMKKEDKILEKLLIRFKDEVQAVRSVSRQAFSKITEVVFGKNYLEDRSLPKYPEVLREEQRAQAILYKAKEAQELQNKLVSHPSFETMASFCEKRLFSVFESDNGRQPHESERPELMAQVHKTADFILNQYIGKSLNPTNAEIKILSERAGYEVDRISELHQRIMKDWKESGQFNKNDEIMAYLTAERLTSIEGRLLFEAKQKGQRVSLSIQDHAQQELNHNIEKTEKLTAQISEVHSLSKSSALLCAHLTLRHKETHGENPSSVQMNAMVQISRDLEQAKENLFLKGFNKHESHFLLKRAAESRLRGTSFDSSTSFSELRQIQDQFHGYIPEQKLTIDQEITKVSQKEFSL